MRSIDEILCKLDCFAHELTNGPMAEHSRFTRWFCAHGNPNLLQGFIEIPVDEIYVPKDGEKNLENLALERYIAALENALKRLKEVKPC